ncbi:MAG: curli biogenesis system outer membrane secretion channel CsgG [Oleiphilaceae bacterium]|jgi:curli biogenesis system outer membrane secretion channel CsgG
MNKHLLSIIFTLLLLPFNLCAEPTLVSKTTTGFGDTYQQALSSALMDAVRQVRGVQVGTEKQFKAQFQSLVKDKTEKKTASIGLSEDIFTQSKGSVHSYTVDSVKKPKDNNDVWSVKLTAKIPEYTSKIEDDKRDSIAVMPFRFAHSTFSINDQGKPSNAFQMSDRMRDRIQTSFTQTQQFAVVNRSYGNEFSSEKALLSSDNVPAAEASRLGQVVGADFMVVGNIHDLSTKTETTSFYGASKTKTSDRVDLSYQLIEVATQKILWADTLTEEIERKEDQTVTETLDAIAGLVVTGVMNVLYPVKILDVVAEDEVYLNQGLSRLVEGDVVAFFSQGRTMTDPDTGVKIKIEGKKKGELTVMTVQAKYSIAELTDGNFSGVKKGVIVRLLKPELAKDAQKGKDVRPTPGSSEAPVNW